MALRQKLHELESRLNQQGGSISDASPYTPATTLSGNNNDLSHQPQSQAPVYIQQDPAFVNVQNRFPAIAFLDSEAFKYGQISVPKAMVEIPVVSCCSLAQFEIAADLVTGGSGDSW